MQHFKVSYSTRARNPADVQFAFTRQGCECGLTMIVASLTLLCTNWVTLRTEHSFGPSMKKGTAGDSIMSSVIKGLKAQTSR